MVCGLLTIVNQVRTHDHHKVQNATEHFTAYGSLHEDGGPQDILSDAEDDPTNGRGLSITYLREPPLVLILSVLKLHAYFEDVVVNLVYFLQIRRLLLIRKINRLSSLGNLGQIRLFASKMVEKTFILV